MTEEADAGTKRQLEHEQSGLAQRSAHLAHIQKDVGSNPAPATKPMWGLSDDEGYRD